MGFGNASAKGRCRRRYLPIVVPWALRRRTWFRGRAVNAGIPAGKLGSCLVVNEARTDIQPSCVRHAFHCEPLRCSNSLPFRRLCARICCFPKPECKKINGLVLISLRARAPRARLPDGVPAHYLRPGASALSVRTLGRQEPALPLGVTKLTRHCLSRADRGMLRQVQERTA